MRKLLASLLFASAVAACGPHLATSIKVDQVNLGRVVVYRNGVAFYERRAQVTGGRLTVTVPRDRVDDFLKSLTVVDAITKNPLPVSFPRQQADYGAYLEMSLELPSKAPADVILTYVTESPAWKPSYRIVVGEKDGKRTGRVLLEGWAIVDNTSGEDWKGVVVGVGSSSALSFRYDLWSVRNVQRETLQADAQFAVAPPTGVSPYGPGAGTAAPTQVAELTDEEIRRPPGHPEDASSERLALKSADDDFAESERSREPMSATGAVASQSYGSVAGGAGGGWSEGDGKIKTRGHKRTRTAALDKAGKPGASSPSMPVNPSPAPPPDVRDARYREGDSKLHAIVDSARRSGNTIVIEGVADANRAGGEQRALDRANIVRNQLIDAGVAPGQVKVVTKVEPGQADRVRLNQEAAAAGAEAQGQQGQAAMQEDGPVGESHFESIGPMTVGKGTSAMVSMVRKETDGEVVYLYDAESERGNDKYAFKAVRLTNPTDSTLETGPVTVYGAERFIGEGLSEPIPPRATAVVPFALDRQIVIDKDEDDDNQISRLVTLQRGILTAEVQHIKRTKLTLTNRSSETATVFIRHTVGKGWLLKEHPEGKVQRVGDANLFEIKLGAGESRTVALAEATPLTRTLDLNSEVALDMMKVFVEAPEPSGDLRDQLKGLLGIHREIVDGTEKIDSLRRRLVDYRERMDELHGQLLTLQAVKTGGELMKHLKEKMKDISDRVQKATIDVVDTEEKLMLARVRFQDSLAELKLNDVLAPETAAIDGGPAPTGGGAVKVAK